MKKQKRARAAFAASKHNTANAAPSRPGTPAKTAVASAAATRKKRRFWPRPAVAIGLGVTLILGCLVWAIGSTAYVRVAIGERIVSGHLSDATLRREITQATGHYHLAITYPDHQTRFFNLAAVGLQTDAPKSVAALRREQRSLHHRLLWWQAVPASLSGSVDRAKLKKFTDAFATQPLQPANNATAALDGETVRITAGTYGKAYGLINPDEAILVAARTMQIAPLKLHPVALEPHITAAMLSPLKSQVAAVLHQHIVLRLNDDSVNPSASDIAGWLTLQSNSTNDLPHLEIDPAKLQAYLAGIAEAHAKLAHPQVLDVYGKVIAAGQVGLQPGDTAVAAESISKGLLKHNGLSADIPMITAPFRTVTAPVAGKWIEVDVSTKRLYAYDQSGLVRSYLVTAGAPGTPTVLGRYAIYAKYSSQNMFGENTDGSTYFQPNVPYVNYFYADYAIHGNYWRPAGYFGFVNSSHGCVGLRVDDSAWLYAWAPIGTPVVVHT
ncbi:MAG TPA: L,D-transpeptidase family protein [Bacillota bacterium]|nr:L,D-transpeptidase family protein [Bacillota bacterium]